MPEMAKDVVVAEVVVERVAVKFWRVVEPEAEMVPAERVPRVAMFELRFVDEAVVAKVLVEVALVLVLLMVVRAVMVEDAETITPTVVVGARYPLTRFQSLPNSEVVAA